MRLFQEQQLKKTVKAVRTGFWGHSLQLGVSQFVKMGRGAKQWSNWFPIFFPKKKSRQKFHPPPQLWSRLTLHRPLLSCAPRKRYFLGAPPLSVPNNTCGVCGGVFDPPQVPWLHKSRSDEKESNSIQRFYLQTVSNKGQSFYTMMSNFILMF